MTKRTMTENFAYSRVVGNKNENAPGRTVV